MSRVYIGLILIGLLVVVVKGYSQDAPSTGLCTVSGEILYTGGSPVYVSLVDESTLGRKMDGVRLLVLHPAESPGDKPARLTFEISDLPPGQYGLRYFADENGNGELDGGVFGPTEPWGMSWQGEPKRGIPKFRDISFIVPGDIYLAVTLRP